MQFAVLMKFSFLFYNSHAEIIMFNYVVGSEIYEIGSSCVNFHLKDIKLWKINDCVAENRARIIISKL